MKEIVLAFRKYTWYLGEKNIMSEFFSISSLFSSLLPHISFFLPCPPFSQDCCSYAHRNLKYTGCKWERTSPF